MAVMMEHVLGPAAGDEGTLLADLDLAAAALEEARAALLARGLLRPAPDRCAPRTFIAPEVRLLWQAAVRPLALGILQIIRPGQPERGVYFSWTPECFVTNTVDENGRHLLQQLDSMEAAAEVILRECGLLDFVPTPAPQPPASPDAITGAASLRAIFMAVASARTNAEQVSSLAWLVSEGQLWVVSPQPTGDDADLTALTVPDLRASAQLLLAQAIDYTQQALAAAEA
jgi:hypothetical protein